MATGSANDIEAVTPARGGGTPRELLLLLPNLGRLLWRLARDRRVPLRARLLVAGVGLYLAMPFDIIPDWIPVIGHLDDLFVLGLALRWLVRSVPPEALKESWSGAIPLDELTRRFSLRIRPTRGGPSR